jgi:hypothetical protein
MEKLHFTTDYRADEDKVVRPFEREKNTTRARYRSIQDVVDDEKP